MGSGIVFVHSILYNSYCSHNMTNEEMNKLADIIVDKLIEKQKEYDEQFHIDLARDNDERRRVHTPIIYRRINTF
jgi:20S proteasome alpha/beta subunit